MAKKIIWHGVLALAPGTLRLTEYAESSQVRPLKVRVRFLADRTGVPGGHYDGEDVHLATEGNPKQNYAAFYSLPADHHPAYRGPISSRILKSKQGAKLLSVRNPGHNIRLEDMRLRTPVGDPMTVARGCPSVDQSYPMHFNPQRSCRVIGLSVDQHDPHAAPPSGDCMKESNMQSVGGHCMAHLVLAIATLSLFRVASALRALAQESSPIQQEPQMGRGALMRPHN